MNYRSKALFSLLPCLFFISILCFCPVAHAQNKAEKCTTQNCVTIKEYQEQNELLKKETNEFKDEIADLNYKIAENKKDRFEAATSHLSLLTSIVTGFFTILGIGFSYLIWFGYNNVKELKNEVKRDVEDQINGKISPIIEKFFDSQRKEIMTKIENLEEDIQKIKNPEGKETTSSDRNAFE
jgi:gas vesicle protein